MNAPRATDGGRALARAGIVVLAGYGIARALGWLRVVVIGTTFGAGPELDTFYAAFRFPDLIFNLVAAGAITAALVPPIAGLLAIGHEERAWRVASSVMVVVAIVSGVFGVVLLVGAPVLAPIIAPGFDDARTALTIDLTRIMAFGPLLLSLGAVVTSVLNATGRFAASMAGPVAYNIVTITAAILLPPLIGVAGLAVGVVVGAAAFLGVQLVPLARTGFRLKRAATLSDPEQRSAAFLLFPRAFGLGVGQLQLIVATTLASGLAAGSVAAFAIAYTVYQIPVGTIGVPLGVVALPALSSRHARGAFAGYASLLVRSLRLMLFVMLPIAGIGAVLRTELVTLLFNYGRFDARAIEMTSGALLFLLGGLAADTLNVLLARAFYARGNTWTPVAAACAQLAVTSTVAIACVGSLGLQGIALAFAAGAWTQAAILLVTLGLRVRHADVGSLGRGFATFLVAAAIATFVAASMERLLTSAGLDAGKVAAFLQLVVAGAAGAASYAVACAVLRVPELPELFRLVVGAVRRERPASA